LDFFAFHGDVGNCAGTCSAVGGTQLPGRINYVNASYPHFRGHIMVKLKKTREYDPEDSVTLSKGLAGTFEYKGKTAVLQGGMNKK